MSSTINALTSGGGLAMAGDTSGQLALQSAGTTYATGNQYGIGLGTAVPSSGIGIAFPATQSASSDANTLDDYEEGTWTPILGGATSQSGQSYNVNSGSYTKIGNQVFCTMRISLATAGTITGNAVIKGLPFTSNSTSTDYAGVSFGYIDTVGTAVVSVNGLVQQSKTSIDIYYRTAASTTQTTAGNTFWANDTSVFASVVYHTS